MATGTRNTYTDTGIIRRAISDTLMMIDWTEAPLLNKLGLNNESSFRLLNFPNTKYEWIEDELSPVAGTINEALDASETGVDIQTGEGAYLKAGDILKVDDELMYVSSVATDTATVVRGYAGTTGAIHSDDAPWERVTIARVEGAAYTTGHTTTASVPYNHTQIIEEAIQITRSEKKNPKYGYSDTMAYHLEKLIGGGKVGQKFRAGTLAIALQKTFYHGMRGAGTATTSRSMGGFNQFVTTNVTDLAAAALTRTAIEDKMSACYEAGGNPDTIVVGAWGRRKITTFYDDLVRTERSEERGGSTITTVQTDFGDLEVMYDRWCPPGELYMFESNKLGWVTYDSFNVYEHDSGGDSEVKDVVGEYGFVLCNEKAHARLHNFSVTS